MAKFSGPSARPLVSTPVTTGPERAFTHEGGTGWARDAKSELFLLAVSNMVGEASFYESAGDRDERFRTLVAKATAEDPQWVARFVPYLRNRMQMRSASVVMACEYVRAGGPRGRAVIDSACSRPDEPAEVLGYWASCYGRRFPQPVKRGVADAVVRLYDERAALRYDGQSRSWRMGDVIELVHPKPKAEWQEALFGYLLDARHHQDGDERLNGRLPMLAKAAELAVLPPERRRQVTAEELKVAGFSWERLSGWLPGGMDAGAWESIIPSMGYMALLRNLRNFDEADISAESATFVAAKLSSPDEVERSRQFPLRFLSAWKAVHGMRWGPVLGEALEHSVANVPELPGRTLVLIDVSGSMYNSWSARSEAQRYELAGVFGFALARRCQSADVVAYDTRTFRLDARKGSILRAVEQLRNVGGCGTYTMAALAKHYAGQDRVIILTDEQAHDAGQVPQVPLVYTFNVAGYRIGHLPSGREGRYAFGGLTDAAFEAMPLIERGRSADWPF